MSTFLQACSPEDIVRHVAVIVKSKTSLLPALSDGFSEAQQWFRHARSYLRRVLPTISVAVLSVDGRLASVFATRDLTMINVALNALHGASLSLMLRAHAFEQTRHALYGDLIFKLALIRLEQSTYLTDSLVMTYPTLALYAELRSVPDATVARIDDALSTTWHTFTKRGRQLLLSDLDALCNYVLHQQAHVNRAGAERLRSAPGANSSLFMEVKVEHLAGALIVHEDNVSHIRLEQS
ncbi:hypothetical protein JCM3766R1_006815 [Sporobolomyces carnicolor]